MALKSSISKQPHKRTQRLRHYGSNDNVITGLTTSGQHNSIRDSTLRNSNDASRLLSLPVELLEQIAGHVPALYLLPFRLVCKYVNQITFPIFAAAFFTEKTFFPSDRSSMETLHYISQRKDLVKYICRIRFSPLIFWCDNAGYSYPSWRLEDNPIEVLDLDWTEPAANTLATPQAQLEYDQCIFLRDDLFNVLLSIFTNLQQLNCRPSILMQPNKSRSVADSVANYPKNWRGITGLGAISPSFDCLYHIPVYRAIVKSSFATHGLDIGSRENEFPLSQFSYRPQQFPAEHLRVLRIQLQASDYTQYSASLYQSPGRRRHIEDFTAVIAKAQNLQHLTLSQWQVHFEDGQTLFDEYNAHRDVFHALATKCYVDETPLKSLCEGPVAPRLEELELDSHIIEPELLFDFCRERRETLTKVHLKRVLDVETPHPTEIQRVILFWLRGDQNREVSVDVESDCYGRP